MARPMKHPLLLPPLKTNKGAYRLHHAPALVLPPISTLGTTISKSVPSYDIVITVGVDNDTIIAMSPHPGPSTCSRTTLRR